MENNNLLTIKGERNLEHTSKEQDYSKIERFSGTFYRQFSLPDYTNTEQIQAKIESGVLTVTVPKKKDRMVKKVKIQGSEDPLLENN